MMARDALSGLAEEAVASDDQEEIRLEDLLELDELAPAASNAERARQQAEFHAREVRELGELIAAERGRRGAVDRGRDPQQAERTRHRALELLCREIGAAFDWLHRKDRPSTDLDLGLEQVRANYDASPDISLLREIAETEYPLLTAIALVRQNGVGLLPETQLALKHAARGRPLSDTMTIEGADALLASWLTRANEIGPDGPVYVLSVRQAIEWLTYLSVERSRPGPPRGLEDELEATIYLARATLDEAAFDYIAPDSPALG
jgi:hypothetical protein